MLSLLGCHCILTFHDQEDENALPIVQYNGYHLFDWHRKLDFFVSFLSPRLRIVTRFMTEIFVFSKTSFSIRVNDNFELYRLLLFLYERL